jgi:hypothetical protein
LTSAAPSTGHASAYGLGSAAPASKTSQSGLVFDRRYRPRFRPALTIDVRIAACQRSAPSNGILIRMFFGDHPPPHFDVRYGEHKARFEIATGDRIDGDLPPRAERIVREWADLHRTELEENWRRCEHRIPLDPVEPLR